MDVTDAVRDALATAMTVERAAFSSTVWQLRRVVKPTQSLRYTTSRLKDERTASSSSAV